MSHLQLPKNPEEWLKVAEDYDEKWNFPHCVGAIDGKHIVIQCPINSGSEFFNYKETFSIVLMALVDANYMFTYVDIGCQGRISDGGVFKNTSLWATLEKNQLMLPLDTPLSTKNELVPYVFVGDNAFALGTHMMKPYSGVFEKGNKKRVYNYRLSRARRVVENVFGILSSVFRVFRKLILLSEQKVSQITMACVLLHNYLRSKTSSGIYSPPGVFDDEKESELQPGSWREDQGSMTSFMPVQRVPRRSGLEPLRIRDLYADYFVSNGAVTWQNDK
ncbi:protein ALP1-like [Acyrthosiphon pisum]|uniref:DDE Tnp4 domain-containing protein n=1 Tax=Acyrthosiphon pisum TaxID=7029 RepID=A0A8R2NUI8_ACYPI|nr:protein ALP1-like [Acyrthosiphon pisum]